MACSRDIRLEADGAVYYFRFLKWDTAFFGRNCYVLDADNSRLLPSAKMRDMIAGKLKNSFVTLKIAAGSDNKLLAFLQTIGFVYIDTEITLKYDGEKAKDLTAIPGVRMLELKKNKGLPYGELGGVFRYSRFHSDTRIPKEKANLLWIDYIKGFRPSKTKRMFIAKCHNEIAGAVLANLSGDGRSASLFFVAVLKRFQGKGIGSSLLRYAAKKFGTAELTVGTQAKNVAALNTYIKNGFSVVKETKIIFHRWS